MRRNRLPRSCNRDVLELTSIGSVSASTCGVESVHRLSEVEQLVARMAHNHQVVGSSPTLATHR